MELFKQVIKCGERTNARQMWSAMCHLYKALGECMQAEKLLEGRRDAPVINDHIIESDPRALVFFRDLSACVQEQSVL